MTSGAAVPASEGRTVRCLLGAVCCVCIAVPFLSVRFPPISDLPQQVAQVRLFLDAYSRPQSPYRIQWFTPYTLSYTVLGAAWACFRPENVGRLAMLLLGVLWTAATHLLAAKRQRPAAAATMVSVLFFNHIVYWGFYSFAIGWPTFVLWFLLTTRPPSRRWLGEAASFFAVALLLYVSHALWFAAGVAWFVVYSVVFRLPLRDTARRAVGILPVCIAAALWYPHLRAAGFVSPTTWVTTPTARLSFSWMADAAFGGIRGSMEYVVFFVLVGWAVVGVWQQREKFEQASDRALLLAGALFALAALLLPQFYQNTMSFAGRWFPLAAILLVLGLPAPVFDVGVERLGALALVAVFSLATTVTWLRFDRIEMSGLWQALAALPANPRVLGLDYVQESPLIKGRPFLQTFAYAQVLHGGELNFSFAGFAPSLVVYKGPHRGGWTHGLEWEPGRLQPSDLDFFDYVIVNGSAHRQQVMETMPALAAVTHHGRWRLYRVKPMSS